MNYRAAVPVGETLPVTAILNKIGNKSVVLKQEIFLKKTEELVADALVTFVTGGKDGAVLMEGDILKEIEKLR